MQYPSSSWRSGFQHNYAAAKTEGHLPEKPAPQSCWKHTTWFKIAWALKLNMTTCVRSQAKVGHITCMCYPTVNDFKIKIFGLQHKNATPFLWVEPKQCRVYPFHFNKCLSIYLNPTLLRLPKPILCIADVFHSGSGGTNWTAGGCCFSTPRGSVHSTASHL